VEDKAPSTNSPLQTVCTEDTVHRQRGGLAGRRACQKKE
jgi:hypothetical protein